MLFLFNDINEFVTATLESEILYNSGTLLLNELTFKKISVILNVFGNRYKLIFPRLQDNECIYVHKKL